jgi:hypothetical protein
LLNATALLLFSVSGQGAPQESDHMATFIVIDQEGGESLTYEVDTEAQIAEAQAALRAHGLKSAPVYAGDPDSDSPDCSYRNGQVLHAE